MTDAAAIDKPLWGADGLPVPAAQRRQAQMDTVSAHMRARRGRFHEGAGFGHAATASWFAPRASGQAAATADRDAISDRVRDLVRNDAPTATAIDKKLQNVVGTGWRLQAKPNARRLGLSREDEQAFAAAAEAEWRDWSREPGLWCDVERDGTIDDLLMLAARHLVMDGEAFAIMGWRPAPTGYATCVQVLHPQRVCNPDDRVDTADLVDGCALDAAGATTGYHVRSAHPGDTAAWAPNARRWTLYPRETETGRPRVLHVRHKREAGMKRAVSDLAAVLRERRQGHQLTDYELQASMLNAVMALFLETPLDMFQALDAITPEQVGVLGEAHGFANEQRALNPIDLPGVQVNVLAPGEKAELSRPNHPNANFEPFIRHGLRTLASRLGITAEQLTGDWSSVNYSSARAAMIEVAKGFMVAIQTLRRHFMAPIYRAFLEEAVALGRVPLPAVAPGFDDMPEAWAGCDWIGAARGYVDPVKEVQASGMKVSLGLSTRTRELSEQGLDFDEVMQQLAREREAMRALGLDPDVEMPKTQSQSETVDAAPAPSSEGSADA